MAGFRKVLRYHVTLDRAALLFIIAAEIMAENIRNNSNINGIHSGRNHEIKLSQLADDTTAFLQTEQDVSVLIHEIKQFSKVSGLNLNMLKTQGLLYKSAITSRGRTIYAEKTSLNQL